MMDELQYYSFDEIRLQKREKLLKDGCQLYPYTFDKTHNIDDAINEATTLEKKQMPINISISITGRVWSQRDMGRTFFIDLKDETNKIQLYCKKDNISVEEWQQVVSLDLGDILGVTGFFFRTKTGELSISVRSFQILTKTTVQIPIGKETDDKIFNRLSNIESKYRERYLHWMLDTDARKMIVKRFEIIKEIRSWMENEGFLEVTTPNIELVYGGAEARPFKTNIWALDCQEAFLRISPELYLKRYLVAGFPKVFAICQNFRNEGIDYSHNPEFTMMEWYEAYTDYVKQMNRFELLVSSICEKVCGGTRIMYQEMEIDFKIPWRRLSVLDALKEYAEIDAANCEVNELKTEMKRRDIPFLEDITWGIAVIRLFEATCEQHLVQPTFIIDHPYDLSPMTKSKRGDSRLVERFEPFVCKMELGNAYSELNDPVIQLERFIQQKEIHLKKHGLATDIDFIDNPIDRDFIKAIGCGLPPTGGVGIGIDRLVMILTNAASIRDIIPFPILKSNNA